MIELLSSSTHGGGWDRMHIVCLPIFHLVLEIKSLMFPVLLNWCLADKRSILAISPSLLEEAAHSDEEGPAKAER